MGGGISSSALSNSFSIQNKHGEVALRFRYLKYLISTAKEQQWQQMKRQKKTKQTNKQTKNIGLAKYSIIGSPIRPWERRKHINSSESIS